MSGDSIASTSTTAGPSTLGTRRKAVLNVPEGNQKITEEKELDPADVRTGDVKQDVLEAIKVRNDDNRAIFSAHESTLHPL
jgi:hypothetical protein